MSALAGPVLSFKNAALVDGQRGQFFAQGGVLGGFKDDLTTGGNAIDLEGGLCLPAAYDLCAYSGEASEPARGGFSELCSLAARYGIAGALVMPDSKSQQQSVNEVQARLLSARAIEGVHLSIGVPIEDQHGKMNAIGDLAALGSHQIVLIRSASTPLNVFRQALDYARHFDLKVICRPDTQALSEEAEVHDGPVATRLGLLGAPAAAEAMSVAQDLILAEELGVALHFSQVSSSTSVRLIREAKARGQNLSADVSIFHLLFDDTALLDYDSNAKVWPPLRSNVDREALREALGDGTLDAVVSAHCPQIDGHKTVPFSAARFGSMSYPLYWAMLMTVAKEAGYSYERVQEVSSGFAARFLGLPQPEIGDGKQASMAVLYPERTFRLTEGAIQSKTWNLLGMEKTWPVALGCVLSNGVMRS